MIPSTTAFLEQDFEIEEQPTHTYKMNLASELVRGYTDYQEAMKQAIYKILNTERYQSLNCLICMVNLFRMFAPNLNAGSRKP